MTTQNHKTESIPCERRVIQFETYAGLKQEIQVIRFDSFLDCFSAWLGSELDTSDPDKWKGVSVEGVDRNGQPIKASLENAKQAMEEFGCWGFCRYGDGTICVWFADDCDTGRLMELIAHEYGHTLRPYHRDEEQEEQKACRYGMVAHFAYCVAGLLKGNKPT